ncbi:hypothetical protein EMN47_16865 [Prolixibacteraceae bacterium JC049]|nr:hypothetical protein [Prolixibacteraceae bacterium JC049]
MFWKLLLISCVFIALFMVGIGIKRLFKKDAPLPTGSCSMSHGIKNEDEGCASCEFRDHPDCSLNNKE